MRCRIGLPAGATIAVSSLMVLNEPFCDPAIRLIVSSISVPPRSLTPPASITRQASSPSLTQEHWMLPIAPCSSSRDTACTARFSRSVGPGRARPARYIGELACTNGSSTNSVKPPVCSWIPRITRRWATQCAGVSTCPYIIVAEVGMPSLCAVVMTSIQAEAGSLPFVSTQRTSSSRISAAVPGSESTPASRAAVSHSRTGRPVRDAPFITSIGENACTWMSGQRRLTSAARSKYAVPGRSGWMPPCMHTSVAPACQASSARSPTCASDSV